MDFGAGFETGAWTGFATFAILFGALLAAVFAFKREPLYIDARTVDNARRIALETVQAHPCGDTPRYDLELAIQWLCGKAVAEAYLISNPRIVPEDEKKAEAKLERMAKRYAKGCKVTITGNTAVLDLWMGPKFDFKREGVRPVHVAIHRTAAPMDIEPGRKIIEGLTKPKVAAELNPTGTADGRPRTESPAKAATAPTPHRPPQQPAPKTNAPAATQGAAKAKATFTAKKT